MDRVATADEAHHQDGEVGAFFQTIARLEIRARNARRRVKWVAAILFVGVSSIVLLITSSLLTRDTISVYEIKMQLSERSLSSEDPFIRRIGSLMDRLIGPERRFQSDKVTFTPPPPEEAARLRSELDEALSHLERVKKIPTSTKDSSSTQLAGLVASAVFSLGAVAFSVLLIQIAVMFMRYHTRLAELYDAQADALRASSGDPEKAYALLQHFSPNAIEIGKVPTTLYEKALETIREVAKKPA